jgi:tetratricopeptide (TPR) repeat protein
MTKKRAWRLTALATLLGAAGIAVCAAQPGNVPGVCDKSIPGNCTPQPSPNGPRNTVSREEARAYSNYVSAFNRALKQYKQGIPANAARGLSLCQSALSSVDEALQYEPGDGDAQTLRRQITGCISSANGTLAVERGDFDQGVSFYREAESEYPESNAFWEKNIAWAESMRQQAIANANARAAAERDRERQAQVSALWTRGVDLDKSGDFKAETAVWQQIIALDPQDSPAYVNLSAALRKQERCAEAEAAVRQAIQLDPKNSYAERELGYVLADAMVQRYAEAVVAFRQAVQLNPNDAYAAQELGLLLAAQHQYADSEKALRQAVQSDPTNSLSEYQLGNALKAQDRYAEAEAEYRKALTLSPGATDIQNALQSVIDLETKAPAGEELKDALNSGGGPGNGDAGNATPSQKALDEANSTRGATVQGLNGTDEDAAGAGRMVIDTAGDKIAAPPVDLSGVGKAPAVAALLAHIPQNDKVKNDSVIQTGIAWYSREQSQKIETQRRIADIQKQIDNKQGDPGILKIEQTQYTNELATIQQNQKTAEDAIKKQLITLDLPWIEQPETPDSKNKEKQP